MCALTQSKIIEIEKFKIIRTISCSDTFLGHKTNFINVFTQSHLKVRKPADNLIWWVSVILVILFSFLMLNQSMNYLTIHFIDFQFSLVIFQFRFFNYQN